MWQRKNQNQNIDYDILYIIAKSRQHNITRTLYNRVQEVMHRRPFYSLFNKQILYNLGGKWLWNTNNGLLESHFNALNPVKTSVAEMGLLKNTEFLWETQNPQLCDFLFHTPRPQKSKIWVYY